MAQAVIGAIRVNLGMDSAQFENGMKRTSRKMASVRRPLPDDTLSVRQWTRQAGLDHAYLLTFRKGKR